MAAVSLSTLRTRAQRRADMEGSSFVGTAEWNAYLNEGAMRLHELLVEAYGNEYVKKTSAISIVGGTSDYALPSDFFKLTGVDLVVNGKAVALRRFEEPERNAFRNIGTTSWFSVPRYRLEGGNIRLYPAPTSTMTGTLIYIPLLQVLEGGSGTTYINAFVSNTDTINFPNGWEKFVTAYAAEQALMKEESDTRAIRGQLERWEVELRQIAEDRDAASPKHLVDVDMIELDPRWW